MAGAVTPERLKLPSGPSSVRGLADEPSVDPFSAQLSYQVPIELPGGVGGLTPQLALTYSGGLGNGPLGIGWTLAQPKIQRSTRLGVPRFDDTDELELSGIVSGRLVSIGNGEYRVEGMGQSVRVRRVDGGFEVENGSGIRYRLGTSAASRQERDAAHTVAWLVESQTNLMGEQIRYAYSRDRNQLYLTSLTWGPGDVYQVTLGYETRSDPTTSYRSGFPVVTAQRLASIRVTAFGTERRAYRLSYDATFSVARLAGVTSTGVAGNDAWPALSFTYAAPVAPAITPIDGIGTWRLNSNGTTLVDLDGDGAAELLQLADGGHAYLANRNGTFSGLQPVTGNARPISALQLQDVDGDGRAELLQDTGTGWQVFKFSKTRWVPQTGVWPGSEALPLKQPATTRFADLNGDGLIDAIRWDNDNLKIHMATRTGFSAERPVARIGGLVLPTAQGRFQDANGDGLDDFLVVTTDQLDVYVGHGDGTFEPPALVAYPFGGTIASAQDIELADLDRDGLIDLLKIESGTVRWYRGRADGTFTTAAVTLPNPEPLSDAAVVTVSDTNGNGSQDVVWSSASGMWRMDMAGTTTAGMLVSVSNGLGLDVAFDYRSSHALSVDAQQSGTPWTSNVPIAMPVPVHKTTALGPGETTRHVSYAVRDGFWDAAEQRFGGFLTTIVTTAGATAAETSTVMTRHNNGIGANRVLRGRPIVTQVFDGGGRRLSMVTNTYQAMPITGLPDVTLLRRAVLKETRTRHEDTSPIRETLVTYSHDGLGRTTRVVDSGRLDLTGDESVKDTTYADDDATWVRDQLCEERVSSATGTLVSHVQHLFGDDTAVQPLCVVGKGWPRETRAWLASESRFVTQSQTRYDARGNAVSITTNGVERRVVYDANGLFPIEERVAAPSGGDLVWRATWDPVLGALTAVTDLNGHTTHTTYDSLGRFTGLSIDNRPPHQIVEYDWTAPYPKTTVWQFDGGLADVGARPPAWSANSRWRQTVEVANGRGDVRYRAQRLADATWIVSDYHEVDPNGRVVFAGRPVPSSQLELSARPAGIVGDTLVYDPLGRLIEQRLPTGTSRTYSYVAFERTTQDADLAPVHSVIDGQGRALLTERSLPDGTHEIVQASYDAAGRLTQMSLSTGAIVRDFTYDTLGRLVQSHDPDLGTRTLTWDDGNRLRSETNAAGQALHYDYDSLGRLVLRDTGSVHRFHYDDARPGAAGPLSNLVGQLAWIEDPTGGTDLGYDELGRTTFSRRRIDDRVSEATTAYAASGLVLGRSYDDGFALPYRHDPAGRLIGVGDLWSLADQDASGLPLHETTGNGVDARYQRDLLGLPSRVTVRDAAGVAIYDVQATRNAANEITAIADLDGLGLDHAAAFTYDGFARLTGASIGAGPQAFTFGYRYDVLHNMTSRTATGPRALGAFLGDHHYGEGGHAPRQLTSITDPAGAVTHTFRYDPAGRQITQDALTLTYDAADRLLRVDGLPAGPVTHAYGPDGARVKTVEPDGSVSYFFGDGTAERNGVREHDVTVGDRVVARVTMTPGPATGLSVASASGRSLGLGVTLASWGFALLAFALTLLATHRPSRRRAGAAGMIGLLLAASCSSPSVGTSRHTLETVTHATFLHTGFGAGPVVFTDATGILLEERRYEPFGTPIDAHLHTDTGDVTGAPDLVARDLNALNKRTEAATGWSDHGARWMAPETARWLTPDPPVMGPDARFMAAPWALHPYQYVSQNPVAYWDPDGRQAVFIAEDDGTLAAGPAVGLIVGALALKNALDNIGSGRGMITTGRASDVAAWRKMIGQSMAGSRMLRTIVTDIGNDSDQSHAVTMRIGRSQPAVFCDNFQNGDVDLDDLERFPVKPSTLHPDEITRGELIAHILAERRAAMTSGNPGEYRSAHMIATEAQNRYRTERGQAALRSSRSEYTATGGTRYTFRFADRTSQVAETDASGVIIQMREP